MNACSKKTKNFISDMLPLLYILEDKYIKLHVSPIFVIKLDTQFKYLIVY